MSKNQLTPEKVEALRLYVSAVTEFASALRALLPRDSVPQPLYEMTVRWAQEATDAGERVYTGIAGDDAPKLKSGGAMRIANLILSAIEEE